MPRLRRAVSAPAAPPRSALSRVAILVAALVLLGGRPAAAAGPLARPAAPGVPVVEVYTMGPGEELFSAFGHGAICVTDEQSPLGRCYNYGTADFSTPGPLTWNFLRGRAQFWVSVAPRPLMEALYRHEDRTLYRQRLPLPEAQLRKLVAALHEADVRERTFYLYHHFNDNCTTRIRDLIDGVTGGALRLDTQVPADPPLRQYVYRGFAGATGMLVLTDLLLAREADRPTTRWQGMFLPDVLRAELKTRLGAEPEVVYSRRGPTVQPPLQRTGLPSRSGVSWMFVVLGGGLALLCAFVPRLGRVATGLVLGGLGLLTWGLIIAAVLTWLRYNEVALLCWPFDLGLLWLRPRVRQVYLATRLVWLTLCALAAVTGGLVQPIGPVLFLCGLPLLVLWRAGRR
jgi:hypothetical protein